MNREDIVKLATELIQNNNTALISTINEEGYPSVCAVIKAKAEGISTFYFSSNRSSEKVQNIKRNPKGSVYFYDAMEYTGLTLTGEFTILEADNALIPEGAYPEGLRDQDYVILQFNTQKVKLYYGMEKYILE